MMKLHAAKLLATVVCCSSVWGVAATPADACFFNWCGGGCSPCGPRYGACYAPTTSCGSYSTGSCGTTTYYAPAWGGWGWGWRGCSPCGSSCSPCGVSCAPCGVGCAPCGGSSSCATGDCSLGAATPSTTPTPDSGWQKKGPKTYSDGEGADGGSLHRTEPDGGFNKDTTNPSEPGDGSTGIKTFKPPVAIQPRHRQPMLTPPPTDETDKSISAPRLPTSDFDEKIAWRPAPERKRLQLAKEIGNARLVRVPAYPKGEWLPVEPESKVAQK